MSNRDGKHQKNKMTIGSMCKCGKGKLERVYPASHPKVHWRAYAICKNCDFTNF